MYEERQGCLSSPYSANDLGRDRMLSILAHIHVQRLFQVLYDKRLGHDHINVQVIGLFDVVHG